MPFRFWEMSIGSLSFLLQNKFNKILKRFEIVIASFSFLIIFSSFFIPNISISNLTLISVLSTSLLIINIKKNTFLYNFLANKFLMHIGNISYSLYLWHWGIISVSKWSIGIHWWTIPFQIFAIYSISLISYKNIEEPIRNLKLGLKVFILYCLVY